MKILVITQSADIIGGANRSLLDVITLLATKYSHECVILAPGYGEFTSEVEKRGFQYYVCKYRQTSFVEIRDWKYILRWLLFIRSSWYNYKQLRKICTLILQDAPYDIVYINDTTNTIGFHVARKLGIPYVWHFRGYQEVIRRYLVFEKPLRKLNKGIIINISGVMKRYMEKSRNLPSELMCVIYNGVVNQSEKYFGKEFRSSTKSTLHCLHCGHISKAKGMEDSIQAIGILKSRGINNIVLHIAGSPHIEDGERYDCFLKRELIAKLGITEQVIFEGEVKDMAKLRFGMDVELMCSIAEPFGRTTVEGMQAGLVVIGANTGATPEIITDFRNGLLYSQGNPKDLADKIELIYNDVQLGKSLSQQAIAFTKTHFTMDKNVKEIDNVLYLAKRIYNE